MFHHHVALDSFSLSVHDEKDADDAMDLARTLRCDDPITLHKSCIRGSFMYLCT